MQQNVWGLQYSISIEELNTRDLTISCYFIKIHRNTEAIYLPQFGTKSVRNS